MPTTPPVPVFPGSSTGQDTTGRIAPARHSLSSWSKIGVSSAAGRRACGAGGGRAGGGRAGGWWGREIR
ncbi:hypothetical protein ABZ851_28020 [Streptomyces sp. NPDC047049]|uniref:hypothetical protein n=1 Tax=Streptomyces sp. NPDC047049 TaxID=3156688 RepID=UPI00340FBAC1